MIINEMYKNELAALYDISAYRLNKRLAATEKALKRQKINFGIYRGHVMLSVRQIKLFLKHNDLPEKITA